MIIQCRTDLDSPPELISMTPIAAGLLQAKLVALSSNGKQMIASKSGYGIVVGDPEVVVQAIRTVVESVRKRARLVELIDIR